MKIAPTMLLVEDQKEPEKPQDSLIIRPDVVKTEQLKGVVRFVGKGTSDMEMIYEAGDVVFYKPNSGREVEVENEKLRLLDIREVLFGL